MHQVLTILYAVGGVAMIVKGEANDKKILRSEWVEQYHPDKKCTDNELHGTCERKELEKLQNETCCNPGYVLHCRQLNGTAFLACLPPITCLKGQFAKLSIEETQNGTRVRLECQQCDNGTFLNKPIPSDKFRNNECENTKTTCTVEPRIYYDEGNASEDAKCACDYKKGYAPADPNCKYYDNNINCLWLCNHKKCGEEEELSQNYTCEKKSTTTQGYYSTSSEFTDSMTTSASRNLSMLTTPSVNTTARGIQDGGLEDFQIVIIVIVVIGVLIGVAILVFCIVRKRMEVPKPAIVKYTSVSSQRKIEQHSDSKV